MQRDQAVTVRLEGESIENVALLRPLEIGEQRVDHDVADQVNPFLGVPFNQKPEPVTARTA